MVQTILGREVEKYTILDMWKEAWAWMRDNGIPLEPYQDNQIGHIALTKEEKSKSIQSMAYFITEHADGMMRHSKKMYEEWHQPDEIKELILNYKVQMMDIWGWPEWGFKDVKNLKPKQVDGASDE
jgi:hypothetical protein